MRGGRGLNNTTKGAQGTVTTNKQTTIKSKQYKKLNRENESVRKKMAQKKSHSTHTHTVHVNVKNMIKMKYKPEEEEKVYTSEEQQRAEMK